MAQNNNKVKDILEQQKSLAEQVRRAQQQAAQASYNQGQRALSEQLRQQRRSMQDNRENLAQQAHLAQRNIQQGATSRGLGSSGLRDLASLQSQTAQGDALRRLATDDMQVQREAMNTRLGLSEQLAQQLMGIEANYLQSLLENNRFGLQRDDMDRDTLLQLIEMSQAEGADTELLSRMAQIAFGDIDQYRGLLNNGGSMPNGEVPTSGQGFEDLFDSLIPGGEQHSDDRLGKTTQTQLQNILSHIDLTKYLEWAGSGIADLLRSPADRANIRLSEARGLSGVSDIVYDLAGKDRKYTYVVNGKRVHLTENEVLDLAKQWHGNKPLVKNGTIKIKLVNGNVKYTYKGRNYGTYNNALNAYNNSK